ncbi:hypothetical protein [Marinigracilibium pacificum]|uniref:GLPGLI family protein n=1 Tax=Marinigracilibium pacificum TaxID=2729599 RepID=A0A848J1U5_9BACT|nr:hypothetical protein [Marinigracilibium pacificum]NMM50793.1 hypothetical protein [Marinigracilibium pacificum]
MKNLFFLLILISGKLSAQTVTARIIPVSQIETEKFIPLKIYTNDSIVNGYGTLYSSNSGHIKFVKELPEDKNIVKKWQIFNCSEINKAEFELNDRIITFTPVKVKPGGLFLLSKQYENESVILYHCYNGVFPMCIIKKKKEEHAVYFIINPNKPTDKLSKRYAKTFDECPQLSEKIKLGDYKHTYDDLIAILDFYNAECN